MTNERGNESGDGRDNIGWNMDGTLSTCIEPADGNRLWARIAAVPFDDIRAELTFEDRLARENGWNATFAARAVEEYRRFAYLAVSAPHEVTPSDEVDQVWHLHLTHSRHYWGEWTEALGRPLHHNPTLGGEEEQARFKAAYEATLESYYQAFREEPPEDLWPDPVLRFRRAPKMQRVERSAYLLVRKAWVFRAIWVAVPIFTALAAYGDRAGPWGAWASDTWVGSILASNPGLAYPVLFFTLAPMLLGVILWVVAAPWRWIRGPRRRRKADGSWSFIYGDGDGDSGCSGCGD